VKQQIRVDATPSKRLYLSIIADYDVNKAICELVDNAIDLWTIGKRRTNISISIQLDPSQQRIDVVDNAAGISEADLAFVIAPGYSKNQDSSETIGIFGVGTKRAVVALAQDVKIRTRQRAQFDDF
jgi:sensor histidine kinase regulating citrate/malate metabolism